MDNMEEMMKSELARLEEKIKINVQEYRQLLKQRDEKKKAIGLWFRPLVQPRARPDDILRKKINAGTESKETQLPSSDI